MIERERVTGLRLLLLTAAVAAAYFVAGRLGLLLAIPPGYATAIWPASGIALAAIILGGARLAPGVALGSFLVNIATSFDPAVPLGSSLVSVAIALGAAGQALFGAWLVARFVGYRNILVQELAAVRMIALGGPAACVLNATVGVGSLWLNGQVETSTLWLNLGTWWVGDTIGVLIFTPLVLVWFVRPYREWLPRQLLVTVPLAVLFAAVVAMFVSISRYEQTRLLNDFERTARVMAREVRKDMASTLNSLNALEGLFASSDRVDAREFDTFARRLTAATPAIQALSWTPVVPAAGRARFEAEAQASGAPGFRMVEMQPDGTRVPAAERPFHAPIRYISPNPPSGGVLGFDNTSEPRRLATLLLARDSGAAAATPPVEFLQGGAGILMYVPLFEGGAQPETVEDRQRQLRGFVVAVLGIQRFMAATERAAAAAGLTVELVDVGSLGNTGQVPDAPPQITPAGGLWYEVHLPFGGRDLRLEFGLPGDALMAKKTWATWLVLAGGLALTGIVGILLLLAAGREAAFEGLVRERTERLRHSEEALRHQATHDALTGLPNRALFLDRLAQGIEHGHRHGAGFALLYLDVDGFKQVNDEFGHAAGDELLRQIARRLKEALRGEDTAARLGGDEFGIVLAAPIDAERALEKARQLVEVVAMPYALAVAGRDAASARIGASIGIALYPRHGASVDELVHAADEAMYQAKKGGKNCSRLAG